jgi:hypothetical protein
VDRYRSAYALRKDVTGKKKKYTPPDEVWLNVPSLDKVKQQQLHALL